VEHNISNSNSATHGILCEERPVVAVVLIVTSVLGALVLSGWQFTGAVRRAQKVPRSLGSWSGFQVIETRIHSSKTSGNPSSGYF
jgi:hypothetical protein